MDGKQMVVDITTSLQEILGTDSLAPEEIKARLFGFTEPLLRALRK